MGDESEAADRGRHRERVRRFIEEDKEFLDVLQD